MVCPISDGESLMVRPILVTLATPSTNATLPGQSIRHAPTPCVVSQVEYGTTAETGRLLREGHSSGYVYQEPTRKRRLLPQTFDQKKIRKRPQVAIETDT